MNNVLKNLALSCSLGMAVIFGASSAQAALPLEGKTLAVGLAIAPPFVSAGKSITEPVGLEVDIINELQRRTGFKFRGDKYEVMNFGEIIELGRAGKLDICGGGISLTDSRKEFYDFSYPYYTSFTALVSNYKSNIKDFPDLNNKHIAAEAGSTASDLIPPEYDIHVTVDETSTNFMAFYRVSRGLSDAIVTDEPLAQAYIDAWPESQLKIIKIVPDSGTNMGLLFNKGTPESKILQAAMIEMAKDGTLQQIVVKHTGKTFNYLKPEVIAKALNGNI